MNYLLLLKTFNNKYVENLKVYISSNTKNNIVIAIFDTICNALHEEITKEEFQDFIYSIHGRTPKIKKAFKQIIKLTDAYILQYLLPLNREVEFSNGLNLADFYYEKGLIDAAKEISKTVALKIENEQQNSFDSYFLKYKIELLTAKILTTTDNRTGNLNLDKVNSHFDAFYTYRKIMLACFSLNRANVINEKNVDSSILNSIINGKGFDEMLKLPPVQLWYNAYLLLNSPADVNCYRNLKEIINKHLAIINEKEIIPLFVYLRNSASLTFKGNDLFKELFFIYEMQAEKQQMLLHGTLNPQVYKNMITVCLRLNNIKQAKTTLEKYKNVLPKSNCKAYYQYNKATILFAQKKYDNALTLLLSLELEDVYYMLGAKRLSCMIYYEIGEMDLLESYLNSFRVYMHRIKNKIEVNQLTAHRNFINTLTKICYLLPKEWRRKNKLIELVNSFNFISERKWLLEKLNKIKR